MNTELVAGLAGAGVLALVALPFAALSIVRAWKRVLYELRPNDGQSALDKIRADHSEVLTRVDRIENQVNVICRDLEAVKESLRPQRDSRGRFTSGS